MIVPAIQTCRTRRLYSRRPGPPYCLNRDSPQARGLVAFWPLADGNYRNYTDLVGGRVLIQSGTGNSEGGPDGGLAWSNDGTAANKIRADTTPLTSLSNPCTLACWFFPNNVTTYYTLIGTIKGTLSDSYVIVGINGAAGGDPVIVESVGGSAYRSASTTAGYSAGVWQHACGVYAATNNRAVYLNGRYKGTNTDSHSTGETMNRFQIAGFAHDGTNFDGIAGRVAHGCAWNVVLTDSEVAALYDPRTRWDLYYPIGRKTYSFAPAPADGSELVAARLCLSVP